MDHKKLENPLWAWFVLVGGGLFLIKAAPGMLFTLAIPLWKPDEISFFTYIYIPFVLGILVAAIWGMKKAYGAIRVYQKDKINQVPEPIIQETPTTKKPVWPWVVIGLGAVLVIGSGPAALMLPMMPLFLAGMSTDSSQTPDYVPILIILIGYGIIIGYIILLVQAIKKLRAK